MTKITVNDKLSTALITTSGGFGRLAITGARVRVLPKTVMFMSVATVSLVALETVAVCVPLYG